MRIILTLCFLACLLSSCSMENGFNGDPNLVSSETFEMKLGTKKVYGVRMQLKTKSKTNEYLGYDVRFFQDDKVWIDTVYTELTPGDTLETEVIFSESKVDEKSSVSFKTQSFSIES